MLKCSDSKHQEGQPVAWTTSAGHVQPFHAPCLEMTVNVFKQFEVKTVQCLNAFSRTPAASTSDKYPSPNTYPRQDSTTISNMQLHVFASIQVGQVEKLPLR